MTQQQLWSEDEEALAEFHAHWEAYMLQQEQREFYWTVPDEGRADWYEYINTTREDESHATSIRDDSEQVSEEGRFQYPESIHH